MTPPHDHNFQENQRIKELHLSEKLVSAQATAGHTMKIMASQAVHTLPVAVVQSVASNAVKTAVVHAHPIQDAVTLVQEAADQTMKTVHHAAAPAVEALSNPETREKLGHTALHVADHIIDEGSRPLTGGIPVYRYTKKAVIVANETISEHQKMKAANNTMEQEVPDQTMVHEVADHTMRVVRHATASTAEAMSTPEGWEKIGREALHVADHIIDEASRPYTGGIPVYKYTKEAIIIANETISENRKHNDHTLVQEVTEQTIRVVHHAATSAAENMSTAEGREKIGRDALHAADHIIDEASRPYTGGIPVYKYTKKAIIVANETISEKRKKKAADHAEVQEVTDQTMEQELADQTIKAVLHAAAPTTDAMSTSEGEERIERDALHIAYHIIDEAIRPYAGEIPLYQCAKEAIIVAKETILENQEKKETDRTMVQEADDQTMRVVCHTVNSTTEAMSTAGAREKIGCDASHVADHIIDEASRPYTGGISVYQYTKEAIIHANEKISEKQKKKADDQTMLQKPVEYQKMVQEASDETTKAVCYAAAPAAKAISNSEGRNWTCCVPCCR